MGQTKQFWQQIIRSVEAEPHAAASVRGASGLQHPVITTGFDDARKRLIIISADPDARSAAMAWSDIQAAMPSIHVIMARPIALDLGGLSKVLSDNFNNGNPVIDIQRALVEFTDWLKRLDPDPKKRDEIMKDTAMQVMTELALPISSVFKNAELNVSSQIIDVFKQLAMIDVQNFRLPNNEGNSGDGGELTTPPQSQVESQMESSGLGNFTGTVDLTKLVQSNPLQEDQKAGVCPIPLFAFTADEVELLSAFSDIEVTRELLRRHDLLQYFFPAPEQLALGLLDGKTETVSEILARVSEAPKLGHPLGSPELLSPDIPFDRIIDALQERGLVVEGEFGVEVTPEGKTLRQTVKFKPRESFTSKLSNIIQVKVDLTSLFSMFGGKSK